MNEIFLIIIDQFFLHIGAKSINFAESKLLRKENTVLIFLSGIC